MDLTTSKIGAIWIMIFAGLFLGMVYLIFKGARKGILANKFFAGGAVVALLIAFFVAKDPLLKYFREMFKDAPYEFTDFKSIVFKYGVRDSMINSYNSATGDYQYLDKRNSLVKTNVMLNQDELLYLHHKATELGFWDFPANELNSDTISRTGGKPLRYLVEFNYRHNGKKVLFDTNYDGPVMLFEANTRLIQEIERVLQEAEDRQKK
jgi:hypothetical protein